MTTKQEKPNREERTPKRIEVFPDYEDKKSYFVSGARGVMEALMCLQIEYPETIGKFLPKHGRELPMSKCKRCDLYWMNEDMDYCSECGSDYPLSKRIKLHWYFDNSKIEKSEIEQALAEQRKEIVDIVKEFREQHHNSIKEIEDKIMSNPTYRWHSGNRNACDVIIASITKETL